MLPCARDPTLVLHHRLSRSLTHFGSDAKCRKQSAKVLAKDHQQAQLDAKLYVDFKYQSAGMEAEAARPK